MALTFPSSPTNGQIYTDTVTGNRYIYDSTKSIWKFAANNVGMSVSSTPPSNVAPGSMWFNREIGRTFVYYDDGDSKQWIETVPAGTVDTNTVASYVNPVFALTNGAYTTANAGFSKANTALQNTSGVFAGTLYTTGSVAVATNIIPTVAPLVVNNVGKQLTLMAYGGVQNCTTSFECIRSDFTGNSSALAIYTNTGAAEVERMRIDSSGNVGIGTNGPVNRLDIQQVASVPGYPVRVLYNSPSVTYANSHIVVQNMNGANGDKALYGAALQATGGNGYNPVAFGAIQTDYLNRYAAYVVYVSSSDNYSAASHERMRIDSNGYVTKPYQPYLRASATGSTFPSLTTGLTIPYNTILEQVGSNYNTSTYRFTAPVAGVYAVYATIEASGTNTTYSNLMICKNGAQVTGTYKNMTGASYQMMDAVAYVKCAVSDYISVIYFASGTSGTIENVDARNSFLVYFMG